MYLTGIFNKVVVSVVLIATSSLIEMSSQSEYIKYHSVPGKCTLRDKRPGAGPIMSCQVAFRINCCPTHINRGWSRRGHGRLHTHDPLHYHYTMVTFVRACMRVCVCVRTGGHQKSFEPR